MAEKLEIDKIREFNEANEAGQAIGEFIEWMADKHGARLMVPAGKPFYRDPYLPLQGGWERYLYEFAGIDQAKMEREREEAIVSLIESQIEAARNG